jgi:hypothetical protein
MSTEIYEGKEYFVKEIGGINETGGRIRSETPFRFLGALAIYSNEFPGKIKLVGNSPSKKSSSIDAKSIIELIGFSVEEGPIKLLVQKGHPRSEEVANRLENALKEGRF